MIIEHMHELIGKQVEVLTADIMYRGILVEIGETEIYLQAEEGWIVVPVERVVDVRAAE
jgi:hypothetical protein